MTLAIFTCHFVNLLQSTPFNFRKEKVHPSTIEGIISLVMRFVAETLETYTDIQQEGVQIYPYFGPQFKDSGLMK